MSGVLPERHGRAMHGYRFLLFALIALLALYPLLGNLFVLQPLLDAMLVIVLWGCIRASSASRPVRYGLILIAIAVVASGLLVDWNEHPLVYLISAAGGFLFFSTVTCILLRDVLLRMTRVDQETLFAAISAYVLIGLSFAFGYMLIDLLVPDSFDHGQVLMRDANETFIALVYFSFVTLSTLGFGDITPRSLEAGAIVYTEAMLGQLYLAVLVARLVGLYRHDG